MKSENPIESKAPGADALGQEFEGLTLDQVEKWLTDDLGRARSLLEAIHCDRNILRLIAQQLHGKAMNYLQAKSQPPVPGGVSPNSVK